MTVKHLLVAGIGASTIADGGVGLAYALKSTSIEQQIISEGRTILIGDSENWNIKFSIYNTKHKNDVTLENEDAPSLKKWCEKALKSDFKNNKDKDYLHVKDLCTTPTNKEKLLHSKKTPAENRDWASKVSAYNEKSTNKNPITGIEIGQANESKISGWCLKELEKEVTETSNVYTLIEKWCAK